MGHTRRGNAVEEGKAIGDLGQFPKEKGFFVARVLKAFLRSPFQVFRPVFRELRKVFGASFSHALPKFPKPLGKALVPSRLQKIRAGCDRKGTAGDDDGKVQGIRAPGIRNVEIAIEIGEKAPKEIHGDGVKGPSGHVNFLARKDAAVVPHGQSVRELYPKR